eukprot:scaffold1164_cov191-Alexandrium_tamarense.AAC.9
MYVTKLEDNTLRNVVHTKQALTLNIIRLKTLFTFVVGETKASGVKFFCSNLLAIMIRAGVLRSPRVSATSTSSVCMVSTERIYLVLLLSSPLLQRLQLASILDSISVRSTVEAVTKLPLASIPLSRQPCFCAARSSDDGGADGKVKRNARCTRIVIVLFRYIPWAIDTEHSSALTPIRWHQCNIYYICLMLEMSVKRRNLPLDAAVKAAINTNAPRMREILPHTIPQRSFESR